MSKGFSSVPIRLLCALGLSLPLLCLASLTSRGAPGGSKRCLQVQQVTLKEVSVDGKDASEVEVGGRYSMFALQAGYGQVTLVYVSLGREGRIRPVVDVDAAMQVNRLTAALLDIVVSS
jgi:hypothetical protein